MPKNIAIKVARAQKDMTQKALAEAAGISRQTMNAIEKGEYNPTIKLCRRIRIEESAVSWIRVWMIYFGRMTRMKKTKSNLDELQELKLLKIEHNGCWLAFWGLLAVILTQIAIGNDSKQDLSGEWIVFMCLALYLTVGCIRNGIWDRKLKPNFKNNIMASSIAAVVMGILWFIISYRNYHKLVGSIATGVIMFFSIEILCFLALTLTSKIYKKRLKKLEDDSEDE